MYGLPENHQQAIEQIKRPINRIVSLFILALGIIGIWSIASSYQSGGRVEWPDLAIVVVLLWMGAKLFRLTTKDAIRKMEMIPEKDTRPYYRITNKSLAILPAIGAVILLIEKWGAPGYVRYIIIVGVTALWWYLIQKAYRKNK